MKPLQAIGSYFKDNYKDMLSTIFFLVCTLTAAFLFCGGMKDFRASTDLPYGLFLILALVEIALVLSFLWLERKWFKIPILIPVICVMVALFVVNLVAIVLTPLEQTFVSTSIFEPYKFATTINITDFDKVVYVIRHILLLMGVYVDIVYFLYRFKGNKQFVWISFFVIAFALFCIIYSYCVETDKYRAFFADAKQSLLINNPFSILFHRNNYALAIFGGIICSIGCIMITHKRFFYILLAFFYMNIIFPMSRVCLVLAAATLIYFFIYKMIVSFKAHTFRNLNFIFLVVFALTLVILMCVGITEIREYISNIIFAHFGDFTGRKELWRRVLEITTDWHCFIGNGHGYFNTVFASIYAMEIPTYVLKSPHNLYLQAYGAGGFLLVACLFALLCFVIYKIIRLYKTNKDSFYASVLALILVLAYFTFEG